MEHSSDRIYEFIYKLPGYDFVSSNAAFFSLLGTRLYITVDRLFSAESVKVLDAAYEARDYGKTIILDITDNDGSPVRMAAKLVRGDAENIIKVRMLELDRLFNGFTDLMLREKESDALLSQNDCVYFSYDRKTDLITSYRYDIGKDVMGIVELDKWGEDFSEPLAEGFSEVVSKFVSDIRNGVRNLECSVTRKDGSKNILTGTAVYSDDIHLLTVGRISNPVDSNAHVLNNRDQLTGLFMKENITNYARRRIDDLRQPTALAIVDIDDFKLVNDNHGHAKGDEVLKRCAAIIEQQVGGFGRAGRIGGDEFFIVFDNFEDKERLKFVLRGIKNMICTAYSEEIDGFSVSTSIGISTFPEDLDGDYDTMFKLADCLLYRAKKKGKNRYIIYDPAKHGSVETLLESGVKDVSLLGSRGMSKPELVCKISNLVITGEHYPLEQALADIINYFGIERIIIYNKTDRCVVVQKGDKLLSQDKIEKTIDYIYDPVLSDKSDRGIMRIDNIEFFEMKGASNVYRMLSQQGIFSLIHHEIKARSGKTFIVSYEAVNGKVTWNENDTPYFRVLGKLLFEEYL